MSLFYTSERIGKNGRLFRMYKLRTLREGGGTFAHQREYVWGGKFMRKWRLDEAPQLLNLFKGDMSICGPRPREMAEISLYPKDITDKLLSVKPGWFSPSGIHFMDEEHILKYSKDANEDYFTKILPIKIALDLFYIDNKCFLLDLGLVYAALRRRIISR